MDAALASIETDPHSVQEQFKFLEVLVPKKHPHVLVVVLNRPRKHNAIHAALWKEIGQLFGSVGSWGDDTRVILLVGRGPSFCAGIDVTDLSFFQTASSEADTARNGMTFLPKIQEMQECFTALEKCPVPVIAAIHGNCIGAGIDLTSAADIRLCSSSATFSVREVAIGLAADVGTLQRLPKIVGNQSVVRELCLTGRDFDAREALGLGLVSSVCGSERELCSSALSLCDNIALHSPVAVRGTKEGLIYARDHGVLDGLNQIANFNALALQSEDLVIAMQARLALKTPKFASIPSHSRL